MIVKKFEYGQGDRQWYIARLGMITGSRVKEIMKSDNLPLVDKLIAEKIAGETMIDDDGYISEDMQRGIDMEPIAREKYEELMKVSVTRVDFAISDTFDYLGVSPDGFIYENGIPVGGVEIKCPSTPTHVKYIRQNQIPNEYKHQVCQYFLVNPDLQWCDFVSYDDRFAIKPLLRVRVTREEMEKELLLFEIEIKKFWEKFNKYYQQVTF